MFFKSKADTNFCYPTLSFSFPGEGGPPDTTFIEDAVLELLKTRRILKCSYPYGFFLEPKSTKKEIYELMQVSVLLIEKKDKCSQQPVLCGTLEMWDLSFLPHDLHNLPQLYLHISAFSLRCSVI